MTEQQTEQQTEQPKQSERDRGLHRHGDPDPSKWQQAEAVTGRPNDLVEGEVHNSTFASRRKRRAPAKQVAAVQAEDKAVSGPRTSTKNTR